MVVQRGQNRGQKRLLEQVGGEQLLFQYVPHRFGRFATTAVGGRGILAIILKHTGARPTIRTRLHGISPGRHVRLALYGRRLSDMAQGNDPYTAASPALPARGKRIAPFRRRPRRILGDTTRNVGRGETVRAPATAVQVCGEMTGGRVYFRNDSRRR